MLIVRMLPPENSWINLHELETILYWRDYINDIIHQNLKSGVKPYIYLNATFSFKFSSI